MKIVFSVFLCLQKPIYFHIATFSLTSIVTYRDNTFIVRLIITVHTINDSFASAIRKQYREKKTYNSRLASRRTWVFAFESPDSNGEIISLLSASRIHLLKISTNSHCVYAIVCMYVCVCVCLPVRMRVHCLHYCFITFNWSGLWHHH